MCDTNRECETCGDEGIPFTNSLPVHVEIQKGGNIHEYWFCCASCAIDFLENEVIE